ncbi:TetR/AcrR family transcriptional regulator [Chloroflexi bacterium TSY]|nr:TetR/AcrR family transcriptional regulator [Chloroflexi bacterium TSY]
MSENVPTESVDLRVRRSRKNLIEALCTLVKDRPLQKISVRDITEEAMVNRSTFYAHFVDKYDLFTVAIGERMRHDLATVLSDLTGFTYNNLRMLIVVGGTMMMRISDDCQRTSMGELIPVFMKEMEHSIYEVVSLWASTLTISKAEAKTLAMFTAGAIFGAGLLWGQQSDNRQSIDELADQVMPLLMEGIRQYTD